jgi:hypothetical protein
VEPAATRPEIGRLTPQTGLRAATRFLIAGLILFHGVFVITWSNVGAEYGYIHEKPELCELGSASVG